MGILTKSIEVEQMQNGGSPVADETQRMTWLACAIWTLGAVFYCYEYYLRVTPSVMTADLALAYHADATTLGNLSACYYYAYTAMQIPVGVLMDKFGPRKILTLACFCCAIGSLLFCATDQLWVASVGRFLVGFGSAFAYVGVLKLTTLWLPSNLFAMFSGLATTLGMVGGISGNLVMTALVGLMGWKPTVYYSAIAGLILTPVLWLVLQDRSSKELPYAVDTPQGTSVLKGLMKIIKNPQMWFNGFYGCCAYMIISAFAELWSIPFLKDVRHMSPETAALANSAVFLGFALGGPLMGWISDKTERRRLPMILGALAAALCLTIVLYVPYLPTAYIISLLFFAGVFASSQVIVFAVGRDNNEPALVGTAVAFTNMAVMMGGVIFQPVIGILLDFISEGNVVNGIGVYGAAEYKVALAALPIMLVLGALTVIFFVRETNAAYQPD